MRHVARSRPVRAPHFSAPIEHASEEVLTWLLRAILVTSAEGRIDWDTRLFEHLGLSWLDDRDISKAARRKAVRKTLASLERKVRTVAEPRRGIVFDNVAKLGDLLGLDQAERDVLALAEFGTVLGPLSECFDCNDGLSARARTQAVAEILGRSALEVRKAFDPDGSLARLGLLHLGHTQHMRDWFSLREDLDAILLQEHQAPDELLHHFVRRSAEPELQLADFPHLAAKIELIRRALEGALRTGARWLPPPPPRRRRCGEDPARARALAKALGSTLLEVAVENAHHGALDREDRLGAFRVCQRYGARFPGSLVLFDEMEDVFKVNPFALFLGAAVPGEEKGFTNRLLEDTQIPTLWCSNQLRGIDRAFLRRFDLVIEVAAPPPSVRKGMLTRHLDGLGVDPRLVDRLATTSGVTPADCERAARVAALSRTSDAGDSDRVVAEVLDLRLKARGERGLEDKPEMPAAYDLRYVNADLDLAALAGGLRKRRRGALLLHGVPGTGKSAWVRHLSESLEAPLVVRYGSDLLDKYVGETEKAIAAMFEEAKGQGAVLFLDEADTFLGSRDSTQHRWEVSHTNELLVRMESFGGIFLAATNRLSALDPACLRRFAIKAEFKSLRPEQALELFEATLHAAGQPVPAGDERSRIAGALRRLATVAPGDFAAVHRRSLAFGLPLNAESLLAGLESECRLKPGASCAAGFIP
jgi:AAA+ superfamily predicted ATPase